jgi:cysteine-rich repeat protein
MTLHRIVLRTLLSLTAVAALALPAAAQEPVCETVDFEQFEHAEAITSLSLLGGTLVLSVDAQRDNPAGAVDPTAYDTERWDDAGNPPPNSSHDDTQRAILCNAASNGGIGECDGIVMMIPDPNFATQADDSDGGFVTLSGFAGNFEIPSYDAVDSDNTSRDIILRVGPGLVQVGTSTGQGNGTVETVVTDPHTFTGSAQFEYEGSGAVDNIEICRVEEPFCGDGIVDPAEECDDGNNIDGDGCSAECTIEQEGGEGCTPGYWKQEHHFDSWVGFDPSDDYETVFGIDASFTKTLLGALRQGGGGEKALGRAAVAALLSAASPDVDYFDSVAGVIARVQAAYASGEIEATKDLLDEQNNEGCPLD